MVFKIAYNDFIMAKKTAQQGQALLVILLVMIVGLTIGLSLATRSVSDIRISSQIEQSSRAFSAAEAGIEAALKGEVSADCSNIANFQTIGQAKYCFQTSQAGGTDGPLVFGEIGVADTYNVWLYPHNADGTMPSSFNPASDYSGSTIDVCWQKTSGSTEPAMEITLIYYDPSAPVDQRYKVSRGAYDPTPNSRIPPNNFSPTVNINCGSGFTYGVQFALPTPANNYALLALRLRPFYVNANVGVKPAATLPTQGLNIVSTGTAGGTTRRVSVIQSYPSLPGIFDYVLFSGTSVTR